MILVQAFGLFVVVSFVGYVASIAVPYMRHRPGERGDASRFSWQIFVPCRDEDAVIASTLDRLRTTFAFAHVWVIDDDSEDATAAIVRQAAERDGHVHLVSRRRPDARVGKGASLNAAYRAMTAWLTPANDPSRTIVVVVDADGVLDPDALAYVAGAQAFGNPEIGAAQIGVRMINRDDGRPRPGRGAVVNWLVRLLVRMQDLEFATTIAAMQFLRVRCGSVGLGGNGQFTRLSLLDQMAAEFGEPWHGALLEDYELGVHAHLLGWRVSYVHDVAVEQEGLTSLRRLLAQRTRWSQGNMQCARYLPKILGSPKVKTAGALEASYYLVLPFIQLAGVVLWPAVLTSEAVAAIGYGGGAGAWLGRYWLLLLLSGTFGVLPFTIWGPLYRSRCEKGIGFLQGIGLGVANWLYVFYMYPCSLRAFYRIVRRKGGWLKTRRNSEVFAGGPAALDI